MRPAPPPPPMEVKRKAVDPDDRRYQFLTFVFGGGVSVRDHEKPNDAGATAATTADGGQTWTLGGQPLPYRSGVAWAKDRWVAVGKSGSHVSHDDGATWKEVDRESYNSVAFTPTGEGWAVGEKGRIAKFVK